MREGKTSVYNWRPLLLHRRHSFLTSGLIFFVPPLSFLPSIFNPSPYSIHALTLAAVSPFHLILSLELAKPFTRCAQNNSWTPVLIVSFHSPLKRFSLTRRPVNRKRRLYLYSLRPYPHYLISLFFSFRIELPHFGSTIKENYLKLASQR